MSELEVPQLVVCRETPDQPEVVRLLTLADERAFAAYAPNPLSMFMDKALGGG